MPSQITNHLLLIEPSCFYANPETMDTNAYQVDEHESHEATLQKAITEFRVFRDMLVAHDVNVTTMRGVDGCPDHIFPNWISTHDNREMVIYPMLNDNRRREKTPEIIAFFKKLYDLKFDLGDFEQSGQFLESTGSLCMDRANRIAYSGLSARTDKDLALHWGEKMGFEIVPFNTESHTGKPVYHTDLVMNIGEKIANICADCIVKQDRQTVLDKLRSTHEVVELSMSQLTAFLGNSLEIRSNTGHKYLVMSSMAYHSIRPDQMEVYERHYDKILHSPIPTIEKYGGGSARCLIMEMF